MSQWYSTSLGAEAQAKEIIEQIEEIYLPFFARSGGAIDMAIFSRQDPETGSVTAYFAPGATTVAKMFAGMPCAQPTWDPHLRLLIGDSRSKKLFFPEWV